MSLFGLMGGDFGDDPFFGGHRNMMRQMDQMMSSMLRDPFQEDPFFNPFPALPASPLQALQAPPAAGVTTALATQRPRHRERARDPFSALAIPNVANIMSSMDQMAQSGNCHMFSSSSVMTMTTGPDGRPQMYQASSSTRGVPGGVRETRRTVNDTQSGTRKMAIGHHIGDRSHIIERDQTQGKVEERQEFVNLEEEEAPQFNEEFRHRTQQAMGGGGSSIDYRPRHRSSTYNSRVSNLPAISSSSYRRRSRPMLSITAGPR